MVLLFVGCKVNISYATIFLWSTNLEIHVDRLFVFLICEQIVSFENLQLFTVRILGDFPSFLSALASNNAFIIKMWLGGVLMSEL